MWDLPLNLLILFSRIPWFLLEVTEIFHGMIRQ